MAFTKIVGAGIHTLSNVHTHNINSSGIITATSFVGPLDGTNGDFSGNVTIDGNLVVNGDTTTLNTTLREVEILRVDANNSTVGAAITQSGTGDILNLYDGSSEVFTVTDGGNVGIADTIFHIGDTDTKIRFHDADKFRIELGGVTPAFSGLKSTSGAAHAKWGINVAIPQAALHIDEAYNHQGVLRVTNGNQNSGYYHQLEMSGTNNIFALWRHFDGSSLNNTYAYGSTGHIWYINGQEKLRVHSNGNVGIATNNPTSNLQVDGTSLTLINKVDNNNTLIKVENTGPGNAGVKIKNSNGEFTFLANDRLRIMDEDAGGVERISLHQSGKVGIGTTNPSQELTLYGTDPVFSVQEATVSSQVDMGTGTSTGYINIQKADGTRTIQINGSGNCFFTTGGNFGIGTGSPSEILTVRGGSTPTILNKPNDATPALFVGDSNRTSAGQHLAEYRGNWNGTTVARMVIHAGSDTTNKDNGEITFRTAAAGSTTEACRIDSGQRLLLGHTSSQEVYGTAKLQIQGTTGATSSLSLLRHGNSPYLTLGSSGGSALGAVTALADDARIGQITFAGADGTDVNTHAASIAAYVDGSVSSNTVPGRLTFQTSTGSSEVTRMTILSGGSVSIGNNPTVHSDTIFHVEKPSGETNVKFEGNATMGARLSLHNNNTSASANNQLAFCDAGGQSTSTIIGYNTDQTNNHGELTFSTRNAQGTPPEERMRISKDGNVSINTQNVSEGRLQVNGDITAKLRHGSSDMYGMLAGRKFDGTSAMGGYAIRYASGYESPWIVGYNAGSSYNNQITFGSLTTADRSLATGVTKRMVIDMHSGMVGIREDDPQRFLHVTGTTSSGAAHFGMFGTNGGNAYVGNTPVVTISTDGNGNAGTNDDKAIFQVGRGGGGAGAAAVTTEHFRVTLGGTIQIGGALNNNTSDMDVANTKLTIKQSANSQEDGIYIERSGERRGWYQYVGGAGGTSDALCWTTNQLGTDNHVLALNRDGKMLFFNNGGVGAWFGALTAPSGDTATLNLVSTADKEASIGLSRSNSLGGITTGWRTTIDTSGHIQVNEHNSGNNPLTIMSKMVRPKFGINTQSNGGTIYTPGTTGFHGTQWITCGCMFPFFYLGERVSSGSSNYSADVLDIYASGHWNGYPKAVIIAHERYYKSGFAVWTFGPYINGSYTLEQVEGWGGYTGTHGNDRNGTVSITHQGNVNTHSGQPIHRYTVTIANSGTYSYTRWYIGFIHTGRGVYMSDTSVADVTSSTTAGACCHMRDISQAQAGAFSFKS